MYNYYIIIIDEEGDNEFDLIGQDIPQPRVPEPTVFHQRNNDNNNNDMLNDDNDDILFDMQDSRIKSLVEMGFSEEEAKNALIACNNDVNEALTMLLS